MVIFGPFCSRFAKSPRRRFRTNVGNMFIIHRLNITSHHLITAYRKRLRNGSICATKVLIPPLALCGPTPGPDTVLQRNWDNLQDHSPFIQSLLEDERFAGAAGQLLGGPAVFFSSHSNLYSSDRSPWHPDHDQAHPRSLKLALYIGEPLTSSTGALRVVPGSHTAEFGDALARIRLADIDPGPHLNIVEGIDRGDPDGLRVDEMPCAVLETEPGDVVAFDVRTWHGSWQGGSARRMLSMKYYKDPETPAEHASIQSWASEVLASRELDRTLVRAYPERWLANEAGSAVRERWIGRLREWGLL